MFERKSKKSSTGSQASVRIRRFVLAALAFGVLVSLPVGAEEELPIPGETTTVAILAQTDSRAELLPCQCQGLQGGSYGLRNAVFKQARAYTYPAVIVDAGDFVPAEDESLREELTGLVLEAMELMSSDAIGLGGLEIAMGPEFLAEAASRLPLVCANLDWKGEGVVEIPSVRWVKEGDLRVAITGYVDPMLYYDRPGVMENLNHDLLLLDPVESLRPVLEELKTAADLVIVLAHADISQVQECLGQLEGIDVMVQGHEPETVEASIQIEGVELMIPGPRSRQVAQLTLVLDEHGDVLERRARVWHLKRQLRSDKKLDDLVRQFETTHRAP
jgi:2',3'-cyclic-nucleotide 2'-phosphodiesterase (5'-nucleotidase family)